MNTKRAIWRSAILVFIFMLAGCATQHPTRHPPPFQVQPLVKEMWTQKADNLVFVLDASASMSQGYNGYEKFDIFSEWSETGSIFSGNRPKRRPKTNPRNAG